MSHQILRISDKFSPNCGNSPPLLYPPPGDEENGHRFPKLNLPYFIESSRNMNTLSNPLFKLFAGASALFSGPHFCGRCVMSLLAAALLVSSAHGSLIFNTGTTNIVPTGWDDINPLNVLLPTPVTLFGVSQSQIRVGSNGGIGIPAGLNGTQYDSSQSPWHNTGAGKPIIAPLWDDLNSGTGGVFGGVSKIGATTYSNSYSITAPNSFSYGGTSSATIGYQVSLFTGNQTVTLGNGDQFNFLANDIVFSYQNNTLTGFAGGSAAVGVTDGNGTFSGMPGSVGGVLASANLGNLPTGENFVLFRSNGAGGYTASIANFAPAVLPEPASVAIWSLLGVAALAFRSFRRRQ